MVTFRALTTLMVLASLYSCSSDDAGTQIELYLPDSIRQPLQFDGTNLMVRISVNGGAAQSFEINDGLPTTDVSVTGILPGQQNQISIVWIEVVEGRNVEISQQQQMFVADGSTIIDAQHDFTQFDYDEDSISNFDERLSGTCVWSIEEECDFNDIPPAPTGNLMINGDFSNGRDNWFVRGDDRNFLNGEYCITSPSEATFDWESYIGYAPFVALENGSTYEYSFDIKADEPSNVVAVASAIENGTTRNIVRQPVSVSTNYERKEIQFSPFRDWPNALFLINIGNNPMVRFCFDNISLSVAE